MTALRFAIRSLGRQPGRAWLGILGVAAAAALMFDMLLLSRGLVVSLAELLDAFGFDVRVMASEGIGASRDPLEQAAEVAATLARLPEVDAVVPLRLESAEATVEDEDLRVSVVGVGMSGRRVWTVIEGRDLAADGSAGLEVIVNRRLAERAGLEPGSSLALRGRCSREPSAAPSLDVRIAGIGDFPFDAAESLTVAAWLPDLDRLCHTRTGEAQLLLVASRPEVGPDVAVEAIRRARPDLVAFSNDEVIERFERVGFAYFQQISASLALVTIAFGTVLITVLLTVSVNQRLGEIAALRAIGFTRRRAATDVLWQAGLLVGAGGLVAIPLGLALSVWFDGILRAFPGVPATIGFFVFEPRTLWLHVGLLGAIACGGALYPAWLVTRLPIATTLRNEVVS